MINNKKCLLVVSIVSALSGCASLDNSPYYRSWHDKAYSMRDLEQSKIPYNGTDIPMVFVNGKPIPEAEPQAAHVNQSANTKPAPIDKWNSNDLNGISGEPTNNNPAYSVEENPFKSYKDAHKGDGRVYRRI